MSTNDGSGQDHIPRPGEASVPEIEADETIPPRPEEAIADTLRSRPDVEDHARHPDDADPLGPLSGARVAPIIAVGDLDRARRFYEDLLGLAGRASAGGGWEVRSGFGHTITLLPGDPNAGSATWPVATFHVDDVRDVVARLRARGVEFLDSGTLPFDIDADGVATQGDGLSVAWMRDPDGSTLTIYSTDDR